MGTLKSFTRGCVSLVLIKTETHNSIIPIVVLCNSWFVLPSHGSPHVKETQGLVTI